MIFKIGWIFFVVYIFILSILKPILDLYLMKLAQCLEPPPGFIIDSVSIDFKNKRLKVIAYSLEYRNSIEGYLVKIAPQAEYRWYKVVYK